MFRSPLHRALPCVRAALPLARGTATSAPDNRIEVFIDDKKVLVEPGTTVLQVIYENQYCFY